MLPLSKGLSSITFLNSGLDLIDRVRALPEIRQAGIESRSDLLIAITLVMEARFKKLDPDMRQAFDPPKEEPVKQGVKWPREMTRRAEEMEASRAAYELGLYSKQTFYLATMRMIMAENNPHCRKLQSILDITVQDICDQWMRYSNQRKETPR